MLGKGTKINLPVIGFVGKKGSGKTSCAEYLQHNFPAVRRPFATRIKLMFAALGLSDSEIRDHAFRDTPLDKLSGKTPRMAMQTLGTDWAREMMHQDFWVNLWKIDCHRTIFQKIPIIVEDVRFHNEAKAVREMGGILIRVVRPSLKSEDLHKSETEQDGIKCDIELVNDGDLDQLTKRLTEKLASGWTGIAKPVNYKNLIG